MPCLQYVCIDITVVNNGKNTALNGKTTRTSETDSSSGGVPNDTVNVCSYVETAIDKSTRRPYLPDCITKHPRRRADNQLQAQ